MDYMMQNGLIYNLQSAFREGYSTETALIKLTDQILFSLDQDEITGLVFVDFKKAFDVVNHHLLLRRLEQYRVSDTALSWFTSYLTDRFQFVALDGNLSERLVVKQGVPQGSILGPLLFLLFVNDLPLHLERSSVDIFADDTTLSANAHFAHISSLPDILNNDLDSLNKWSAQNKMLINTKKTKSMVVVSKRIPAKFGSDASQCLNLKMDGAKISVVTSHMSY
jgi:hypothetical protein